SNVRPNVHLQVRKIEHLLTSFKDLEFLVPVGMKVGDKLKKLMVFFDSIKESIKAAEMLRARLLPKERTKIRWFNARMSPEFREDGTQHFKDGDVYGLCVTDSFGMGVDVTDIEIIVQWQMSCDMNTLWQRFGRAAWDQSLTAIAILLVEAKYFDEAKQKAKICSEKKHK
ncbi:hypothetical protein POSPLADRAFT_1109487, partial [Postia placenta MAD-698-R-SB12]